MSELDLGSTPTTTTTTTTAAAGTPAGWCSRRRRPCRSSRRSRLPARYRSTTRRSANWRRRPRRSPTSSPPSTPARPEFTKKVESITSMGDKDLRASASVSSRMLDRPGRGDQGQQGRRRRRRADPGGEHAGRPAPDRHRTRPEPRRPRRRQEDAQVAPGRRPDPALLRQVRVGPVAPQRDHQGLDSGQDELRKDNAAIETEKANMWTTMGKLSEYQQLAAALDDAVTQKIAELEAAGRTEDANTLKSDALFAIRQRRQDIMTQMAVSVQGYMALDLVRKNNIELIKGVDRAQTTTVSALRTAVIVSQALARQKLVLDQITALNATTSNLIESTSNQLKIQGAADQPAGGEQHDRRPEAAGGLRQRLPDHGRDRHVPRAGGRLDGADRHCPRGPDRAGRAVPGAHPARRRLRRRPSCRRCRRR